MIFLVHFAVCILSISLRTIILARTRDGFRENPISRFSQGRVTQEPYP